MKPLYTAKEIRDRFKISSMTLHKWRHNGQIEYVKMPSGRFMYSDPLVDATQGMERKSVIYARVSNTKQKEDLVRQIQLLRQYIAANGKIVDREYSDIASGMNENRKGLNALLEAADKGEIDTVYITYRDRLTRFGFGYLENFLKKTGVEIVVINATAEADFQTELTQDLVSIIHHFSMKMYSNRRKVAKEFATHINTLSD